MSVVTPADLESDHGEREDAAPPSSSSQTKNKQRLQEWYATRGKELRRRKREDEEPVPSKRAHTDAETHSCAASHPEHGQGRSVRPGYYEPTYAQAFSPDEVEALKDLIWDTQEEWKFFAEEKEGKKA